MKAIQYDVVVMVNRRDFIRYVAGALPLVAFEGKQAWAAKHIPIGLQLYTVRSLVQGDLPELLKKIHSIGYEEVETAGAVYQHPAAELRQMIVDAGLRVPSGHFDYNGFADKLDYAKQLGLQWAVCPIIPRQQWSLEGFRTAAKQFNEWGRLAKDKGMRFAFHNHDYEFRSVGTKTGYDVLIEETDPGLVYFEIDCYWVAQSGNDPLQLLRRLGKRAPLLHLKDRKPGFPPSYEMNAASAHFTEVGHGNIAWTPILDTAEKLGVEHYFVEQDETDGPPLESIAASYKYLRTLLP